MSLKNYQTELTLGNLYKISRKAAPNGISEQMAPNLFINTGTVDVYVYNGATQPANRAAMVADTSAAEGLDPFTIVPTYISIVQDTGTTTELVVSCLDVEDLGAIS